MYFSDYKNFQDVKINPALLWEYNLEEFNFTQMKDVVIQRVIERGWPSDFYFILNYYGLETVKKTIETIPYLSDRDMHFVSTLFNIPLNFMKCFEKKQLTNLHWNS